ncbi:mitochondrial carrier homolog 2-like [Haematobia irritans]|uniref:mitochondrial carrier homolog 2-like n=1 Tax=Haematobia irritans TaxID=7368 RepID=UPI003F500FD7
MCSWIRFGMLFGYAALHPLEYFTVLVQLGHEPISAVPGLSVLGEPIMILPNIFQYIGHIQNIDGFYGCYRGFLPELVAAIFRMLVIEIADRLGLKSIEGDNDEMALSDEEIPKKDRIKLSNKIKNFNDVENFVLLFIPRYIRFKQNLKYDVLVSVLGIIVSHLFRVISARMMAQFIGRESLYKSILGSIAEIYKHEGIAGFFSGILPKILYEVSCVVLTSPTVFLLSKYLIKDKLIIKFAAGITQYAFSCVLYPLNVVSTCMTVSGSRIMAGQLPIMPQYSGWMDCFSDLQARKELNRGGSLFWRSAGDFSKPMANNGGYVPIRTLAKYQ